MRVYNITHLVYKSIIVLAVVWFAVSVMMQLNLLVFKSINNKMSVRSSHDVFVTHNNRSGTQASQSVTKVIVMGYMRGGTTLMGTMIRDNPDAFYMFEPIDGVISNLYATRQSTTPLDNVDREIPEFEMALLLKTMQNIFHCEMQRLPTEVLSHTLMQAMSGLYTGSREYSKCMKRANHGYWNNSGTCTDSIRRGFFPTCGTYRVASGANTCRKLILETDAALQIVPSGSLQEMASDVNVYPAFIEHNMCLKRIKKRVNSCSHALRNPCVKSSIRSFKDIRLDMRVAGRFLDLDSSIKILYHVRDPRALALGRRKEQLMSFAAGGDVLREAELLCKFMLRELQQFSAIARKHKSSVLVTKLEAVAENPSAALDRVYSWLGRPVPQGVRQAWLGRFGGPKDAVGNMSLRRRNATETTQKWRKNLSPELLEKFNRVCRDTLEAFGYPTS